MSTLSWIFYTAPVCGVIACGAALAQSAPTVSSAGNDPAPAYVSPVENQLATWHSIIDPLPLCTPCEKSGS